MAGPRSLASWTDDLRVEFFDLYARGEFMRLSSLYAGLSPALFEAVVHKALDAGARTVVAEHRYLDSDYRSEHSAFYSTTFRRYPSIAHRLHFFADDLDPAGYSSDAPSTFPSPSYLGYSVIRPLGAAPVGRTLLRPPAELVPHVSCRIDDDVNLFGTKLNVSAAPFMSQDAQLGVCVHVTAWTVAYLHQPLHGRRWLPSEIAAAVPLHRGRRLPVPTEGLTIEQLTGVLDAIDLSPVVYATDNLGGDRESIFSICCRYLNSGLPVIAAGGNHAFVLVGYRRVVNPDGGDPQIQFIRQDDQSGPYQIVDSPYTDDHRPWDYLVVPLPKKLYVSGERAERAARAKIDEALNQSGTAAASALADQIRNREVKLRSTALLSNNFKQRTTGADRPMSPRLAGAYHWMPMPKWIWAVELVRSADWDAGQSSVIGEVLVDATDHTDDLRPLAWRLGETLRSWDHDTARSGGIEIGPNPPLRPLTLIDPSLQHL